MYVRMRISHGGVSEELDTSLESIYVKTTCESEELEEEEDGQIVSLGDSRMQRVHGCLAILSMLTV